ncbi:cell division protein FtsZ [Terrarubrum flagellatum]|uniref:cell division protein FtsZ n=1 Tax=Terrirubrum flagellatum TaxID=2895980 RepID=UPI0031456907
MTLNLQAPGIHELKPHITVFGCGGAGGNAVNNMVEGGLVGCDFVVANTDAQALAMSKVERRIQMGLEVTQGLGAGAQPEIGRASAEEVIDEIRDQLAGAHMVFITAGMGGGTGTGAAPVVARAARDLGILTVGVVTKPFHFEGTRRMRIADAGITELQKHVDTLIVIPNQNLFRIANEKTTFAEAFALADQVLYSGVASVTDLMVKEGLINLDFADVRSVMREMGKAMMGTGEATGEGRALAAAEAAISNPLLDETSMKGARGLLISVSGGADLTLYEIDEAANRIRQEVDEEANVIFGATRDDSLDGVIRVSVVATGIDKADEQIADHSASERRLAEVAERIAMEARARHAEIAQRPAAPPRRVHAPVEAAPAPIAYAPVPAPAPVEAALPPAAYIEPAPLPQAMDFEPAVAAALAAADLAPAEDFAPPRPDPVIRPMRMPRMEELPAPAQRQIEAARPVAIPAAPTSPVESKRMTLLQRLAAVGLGRKEDEAAPPPPATAPAAPLPVHNEYARRPIAPAQPRAPQGQLDSHGRAPIPARSMEEEQLEIPAFLRRQAN